MENQVNWDQIEAPKSNLSDKFLKLEAGGTYTVRLIKKPIAFWKYTVKRDNKFFVAITDNPSDSDFKLKHPELRAAFRLAILVLHREDSNKLKILEGPRALFENFTVYHGMVGIDPGSNESGDFRIKVICPNGKKDKDTKYQVSPIKDKSKTPFTAEEKSYIKENIKDFNLEEIFVSQTPQEIEKKLFNLSNSVDSD